MLALTNILILLLFVAVLLSINVVVAPSTTNRKAIQTVDDLINRLIRSGCPHSDCKGADCQLITERKGCQLCACPIGSKSRGCDQMVFGMYTHTYWQHYHESAYTILALWYDIMTNGCPNDTIAADQLSRYPVQKVARWYRKIDHINKVDECRSYEYPLCAADLDFNLWRSPESPDECLQLCYNDAEKLTYSPRHNQLFHNETKDNSNDKHTVKIQ